MVSFLQPQLQSPFVDSLPAARRGTSRLDGGHAPIELISPDRSPAGPPRAGAIARPGVADDHLGKALVSLRRFLSGREAISDWPVPSAARKAGYAARTGEEGRGVADDQGAAQAPSWADRARCSVWGPWQ